MKPQPLTDTPRWAFLSKFVIPDFRNPSRPYLTRWRILQTPWFGVYLHRIHLPDTDRHLHDHPWTFGSIVLRGGYIEELPVGADEWIGSSETAAAMVRRPGGTFSKFVRRGWLSVGFRRAEDLHRIDRLYRTPTWTLVLVGRRRRTWGFQVDRQWIPWRDYIANRQLDPGSEDPPPARREAPWEPGSSNREGS